MDKDYIEYFTDSGDRITGVEAEIYMAADNYKNSNKGLRKSSALYQKDAFIHGSKWMLDYLKNKNMENKIEQIKSLVNTLNIQNIPLMEKPSDNELRCVVRIGTEKGKYIKTSTYSGNTYWGYPNGVEEKVEDDKTYKVWVYYRDASDPCDSTTCYQVKYIEEVPDDKIALIKYLEKLLKELN